MNDEQRKPTAEELLQTKDNVLEQWRLLPAEHQATMLLVLLKEIADSDMNDWTRNAIVTLASMSEHPQHFLPNPIVTRERLAELDIDEQQLTSLTDDDLVAIAESIQESYSHDEFWEEIMDQVLEFHTEQVLKAKRFT
ncbi:MAG: hypothetical protein GC179_18460 [Anaerolineaceae bacterium]|nr:hypothetical protein [Anaerolineaceae bacterium]